MHLQNLITIAHNSQILLNVFLKFSIVEKYFAYLVKSTSETSQNLFKCQFHNTLTAGTEVYMFNIARG